MGKKKSKKSRDRAQLLSITLGIAMIALLFMGARMLDAREKGAKHLNLESVAAQEAALAAAPTAVPTAAPAEKSPAPGVLPQTPTTAETPAPEIVSITISAAGDVTLGGAGPSANRFYETAKEKGMAWFFEKVAPIFEADDFTLINLEGPLTDAAVRRKNRTFNFRGSPKYVEILNAGGVEVANLSNNHALDYLEAGRRETKETLSAAGIGFCDAKTPYIGEIRGVKIGFLGFFRSETPKSEMAKAVRALKDSCDIAIVSMHAGVEGSRRTTGEQRAYAHAMVDAGADLVIGHHPHVVQGIEVYKGVNIVYSLGNFCFAGNSNPTDKTAIIYQQTFHYKAGSGVDSVSYRVIPCMVSGSSRTNDFQPTPAEGKTRQEILNTLKKSSKAFKKTIELDVA